MTALTLMTDPWLDRFRTPTDQQLFDRYAEPTAEICSFLRTGITGFEGVGEDLTWMGIPWRWAMRYQVEGDVTPLLAVLAPLPERPVLCIPLTTTVIEAVPARRLTRFIREGIQRGPLVGGVLWCEWEPNARSQADELVGLVKRKYQIARDAAES